MGMLQIELYINGEAGGYHTLFEVRGHQRTMLDFTSTDTRAMMTEALRLISEKDSPYDGRVRVFDSGQRVFRDRNTDRYLSVGQLRLWSAPTGTRLEPVPGEGGHHGRDRSIDLMLGRLR